MSSEVKRVPLDFNHPLDTPWPGYVMPEHLIEDRCPDCEHGYRSEYLWLEGIVHLVLMLPDYTEEHLESRREYSLSTNLHPWLADLPLQPKALPGSGIVALTTGLAGRAPRMSSLSGHDSSDVWSATRSIIKAAGLDFDAWALCPTCNGTATVEKYPGQRTAAELWTQTDPPSGGGWQLWRRWEKAAPLSPVFATAEDLAQWFVRNAARSEGVTFERALSFVNGGWDA